MSITDNKLEIQGKINKNLKSIKNNLILYPILLL